NQAKQAMHAVACLQGSEPGRRPEGVMETKKMNCNTTNPLTYEEACHAFSNWAEGQPGEPQTPNEGLSEEHDGLWHLENINGPLAVVTADGEVVPVAEFHDAYE